ncbi:MAG: hypothetical protein OQL19_05020 [Gammaproteobacteria bacterium]|nr:hypothetical protein [Gammaproteobacteria bacterium]
MYKKHHNLMNSSHEHYPKSIHTILLFLSVLVIFLGVSGIIEHKSPENLATLSTLSSGFFTYFEYHLLIISGALSLTFSMWFMKNH